MSKSLWVRVVVAFVLFLSVGTIGLVFVLDAAFERVSLGQFQALSEANADFIRTMHLPPSDRLAGYLSRMLGAEVQFHRLSSPDNEHEAVTVPIENGVEMTLIRQRPSLRESLMRPVSVGGVLGIVVCAGLGGVAALSQSAAVGLSRSDGDGACSSNPKPSCRHSIARPTSSRN
jgi:hypothetical protein